jgi:hypothetical protein
LPRPDTPVPRPFLSDGTNISYVMNPGSISHGMTTP